MTDERIATEIRQAIDALETGKGAGLIHFAADMARRWDDIANLASTAASRLQAEKLASQWRQVAEDKKKDG